MARDRPRPARRAVVYGTIGEAEFAEIFFSEHLWDGEPTAQLMAGAPWLDVLEHDWLLEAWRSDLFFAIERCCDHGGLLPRELREARLAIFPLNTQIVCETHLRHLDKYDDGEEAIAYIYWLLRIDREKRTGSPEFNERRSTTAWIEPFDDD